MIKGAYRDSNSYKNRVEKFGNELIWGIDYSYKPQMPFCEREVDSTFVHIIKEVDVYYLKAYINIDIEIKDNKIVDASVDVVKGNEDILDSACDILADYTIKAIRSFNNPEIKVSSLVSQFVATFKYYRGLTPKAA